MDTQSITNNSAAVASSSTSSAPKTSTLQQSITKLYNSESLSDVCFELLQHNSKEAEEKKRIFAHKLILALRSPVFLSMFYGSGMKEASVSAKEPKHIVVEESDIDYTSFSQMLQFMYTDAVSLSAENIIGTLYAAKKYQVEPLIDYCVSVIENEFLDPSSVVSLMTQAHQLDEKKLAQRCFDFFLHKFDIIWSSTQRDSIREIPREIFQELIKHDELNAPNELHVFEACLMWAEAQAKQQLMEDEEEPLHSFVEDIGQKKKKQKQEPQVETKSAFEPKLIRKMLSGIIENIRFPLIPTRLFALKVVPTNLLDQEEVIDVLTYGALEGMNQSMFNKNARRASQVFSNVDIEWNGEETLNPHYGQLYEVSNCGKTARKIQHTDTITIIRAKKPLAIANGISHYQWTYSIDHCDQIASGYSTVINVGIASASHRFQSCTLTGPKAWSVKDESLQTGDKIHVDLNLVNRTVCFHRTRGSVKTHLVTYHSIDDVVYPALALRVVGSQVTIE